MKRLRIFLLVGLAASVASANPSGRRWATPPVQYRIAASVGNHGTVTTLCSSGNGTTCSSSAGGVAYSTVLTHMQNAFSNWTAAKVTGCSTSWDSTFVGTFADLVGLNAADNNNNRNSVVWLGGPNPSDWIHGSATLGLTTVSFINNTTIVEADMELNDNWGWSGTCPSGGPGTTFDYESVVLHEAGHFLGLDHSASSIAVMYASVPNNTCKQTLTSIDTSDVCTVYPNSSGGQGSACTTVASCTTTPSGSRACSAPVGSTGKICTITCTMSSMCPTGYTCQAQAGGGSMACLPQVGAPDLCKFCTSGADCSTGQCVTDGAPGHFWCSSTCTTAADCGAAYTCVSGVNLCAPTTKCTNQCTGTGQSSCAVGFGCVSGQCEPTGNVGDHCEISGFCNQCGICIGTNAEAYCRVCCGGTNDCNMCPNGACTTGNTCTPLNAPSTDKVCIPTTGSGLCTACTASPNNCLNGASCLAGRCHTLCNPQNPGTCGACLDQGGTNGVCACTDEVATKGQSCGVQTGGGFFACQSGLVCAGTPQTCMQPCAIGVSGSCASGEVCQLIGGKSVCVADTAGAVCAACNTTGTACAAGLVCQASRCYVPCNVNTAGACSNNPTSCAQQLGDGSGVCACADQIKGVDQACQGNPIAACQSGLKCIAGACRAMCNVSDPFACGLGLECKAYTVAGVVQGVFCQTASQGAGGGGGGSSAAGGGGGSSSAGGGGGTSGVGGNSGTGGNSGVGGNSGTGGNSGNGGGSNGSGGQGGTVTSQGCGCSASTSDAALWAGLMIVAVMLWRRQPVAVRVRARRKP